MKKIWTKERCLREAKKHDTKTAFLKYASGAYAAAAKNGWKDECCAHMTRPISCRIIWTKETCAEEALKYNTKAEFTKGSSSACATAYKNGWIDDICGHMISTRAPDGYYHSKDNCAKEAKKYTSRTAFQLGSPGARASARRNGWMDEICAHMIRKQKPTSYWTKERCAEEALKYKERTRFMKGSGGAYSAAHKKGWLVEICKHMTYAQTPDGTWTKDRCAVEALEYTTKQDFRDNANGSYQTAAKNGWMDDICGHMEVLGNRCKRAIYAVLFPVLSSAYTGLSYNPKTRLLQHISNSSNKHVRKLLLNGERYEIVIYDGWYDESEAGVEEQKRIDLLEDAGYESLNIAKAGAIGCGTRKWTKEACAKEALQYTTRSEFMRGSSGAYKPSWKNGWLDEICAHMPRVSDWSNKKDCAKEALQYTTRTKFQRGASGAWDSARRNGWMDEICAHMPQVNNWTKERCAEEAKKYTSRSTFKKGSGGAFAASKRNDWLNEFFPKK